MKKYILSSLLVISPFYVYAVGDIACGMASFFFIMIPAFIMLVVNYIITYKNIRWKKIWLTIINALFTLPLLYITPWAICSVFELHLSYIIIPLAAILQLVWVWRSVQHRIHKNKWAN